MYTSVQTLTQIKIGVFNLTEIPSRQELSDWGEM